MFLKNIKTKTVDRSFLSFYTIKYEQSRTFARWSMGILLPTSIGVFRGELVVMAKIKKK